MNLQTWRWRVAARAMRLFAGRAAGAPATTLARDGVFRILVCRASHSLGNTLLVTPLLAEIEATWPGAEVDVVTRSAIAPDAFRGYACVRDVIVLPRRGLRHPLALLRGLRRLARTSYDLAIDTDPRSHTGRALLLRSRARHKLGFAGAGKSGTIACAIDPAGAPPHHGHFPVYLLRSALRRPPSRYPSLDLRLTAAERELGAQALARLVAGAPARRGVIGVFANATGAKQLPADWWRAFMPVVEAHFADWAIVEIVPIDAMSMLDSRYPAYYSSQLRRLAGVLSQLSLLVCLDCGVMHLARAAGTRTAAIFTQTDAAEWGPYGDGAHVVDAALLPPDAAARAVVAAVDRDAGLPSSRVA